MLPLQHGKILILGCRVLFYFYVFILKWSFLWLRFKGTVIAGSYSAPEVRYIKLYLGARMGVNIFIYVYICISVYLRKEKCLNVIFEFLANISFQYSLINGFVSFLLHFKRASYYPVRTHWHDDPQCDQYAVHCFSFIVPVLFLC